jgi:hypothetical protein
MKVVMLTVLCVLIFASCGRGNGENENGEVYTNDTPPPIEDPVGTHLDPPHIYILDGPRYADSEYGYQTFWVDKDFDALDTSLEILTLVREYFDEIYALFDGDGGELWGVPLHAPFLFFDPLTRGVVTNRGDYYGVLSPVAGGLYVGLLPQGIMGDTADFHEEFGGVRWVGLNLMAVQPREDLRLGWFARNAFRHHWEELFGETDFIEGSVNELEARISIRLEIAALLRAVNTTDDDVRLVSITHALSFRADRRAAFPYMAELENSREIVGGLPWYTEWTLATQDRRHFVTNINWLAPQVQESIAIGAPSSILTGLVYAFLLDDFGIAWRENPSGITDLGRLLEEALDISVRDVADIDIRRYGFTVIEREEREWAESVTTIEQTLTEQTEAHPILKFYLEDFENPHLSSMDGSVSRIDGVGVVVLGDVYFSGSFGTLEMPYGIMVYSPENYVFVIAENKQTDGNRITAEAWTLYLNDGYGIMPYGENFRIVRR